MKTTPRSRKSVFSKKLNSFIVILTAPNMALLKCCHAPESPCIPAKTLRMIYMENSEFGVDVDLLFTSIKAQSKGLKQTYDIASKLRKCGINFHPENKTLKQETGCNLEASSHEMESKKEEKVLFNAKEYRAIFALTENIKKYSKDDVNTAKIISNHIVGRDEESIEQFLESNVSYSNLTFTIPFSINVHHEKKRLHNQDEEIRQKVQKIKREIHMGEQTSEKKNPLAKFLLLVSQGHLTLLKCKHQFCDHSHFRTVSRRLESITMPAKPDSAFGIDEEQLFRFLQNMQLHELGMLPKTVQGFRGLMHRSSIRFHEHSKSHILNPAFDHFVENAPPCLIKTVRNKNNKEPPYNGREDKAILALTEILATVKKCNMFKIVSHHLFGRGEISIRNRYFSNLGEIRENYTDSYVVFKINLVSVDTKKLTFPWILTTRYVVIVSRSEVMILKCENKDACWIPAKSLEAHHVKESEFGLDTNLLVDFVNETADEKVKDNLVQISSAMSLKDQTPSDQSDEKVKCKRELDPLALNVADLESLLRTFSISFHPHSYSYILNKDLILI